MGERIHARFEQPRQRERARGVPGHGHPPGLCDFHQTGKGVRRQMAVHLDQVVAGLLLFDH